MEKKNFFLFLVLMLAALMLSNILFPQPQPPKKPLAQPPAVADGKADGAAEDKEVVEEQPAPVADEGVAEVPRQIVTLGSVDVKSGYRMLVAITNQGAAIHRVELASARFRDLHDRSGYLGHLSPAAAESGGVLVNVVGAGTPAAMAGIKPGDVLLAITRGQNTAEVKTPEGLASALQKTKPNQKITLKVRHADGQESELEATLGRRPLEVVRPERENVLMRDGKILADFVERDSYLLNLREVGGQALKPAALREFSRMLEEGNWEVVASDEASATFRRQLPRQQLEIVKKYTLAKAAAAESPEGGPPAYDLELEVELRNLGEQAQKVAYTLEGPSGLPIEGWWWSHKLSRRWFRGGGLRDVVVRFFGTTAVQFDCTTIAEDDVEPMGQGKPMAFIAVDAQYFAAAMLPKMASQDDVWFDEVEAIRIGPKLDSRTPQTYTNVSFKAQRKSLEIAAGESVRDSYRLFFGPKREDLLAAYYAVGNVNYNLSDLLYYGWPIFGATAKVMQHLLHFFYSMVGNYGIAIIMLTVLVRGLMFPLSWKQTQNMAKMQALKPDLDRINEKYKTDMQKRSQAMQEVYRKHNVNPLGGCLPMFIQLPIFIGLYRALAVDVELRQSALFSDSIRWCSNLAAPDMFYDWSWLMPESVNNGIGIFGLGPYLNVLPLVTVALFLVTQKMFMPPPANEQMAVQQKVMMFMTVFIGLMFYKVASGLCLYFIASSLWGIGERKLLPKTATATGASETKPKTGWFSKPAADKSASNGSPSGKSGKAKRKR